MGAHNTLLIGLSAGMRDLYADAITEAAPGAEIVPLNERGEPVEHTGRTPDVLLVTYDFFLSYRENPVIADNLQKLASSCQWVQAGSAGADDPLMRRMHAVAKRYCNAAGVHAVPIAQYVFAQLLRWYRRIDAHAELQKKRQWAPSMASELTGKTLGILGYGGIGREVARLGQAFGMRPLGWRRRPEPDDFASEVLGGPEGLRRIVRESQCLVLCLPQSEATDGLMSAELLGEMPEAAVLVNVGRGNALDESALVHRLQSGDLACAILDTTSEEPLPPESPLWDAPNCYLTPHDSAWSPLAAFRLRDLFCDNLRRFVSGEPLRNEEELPAS